MTDTFIDNTIRRSLMSEDQLCFLTPILARQGAAAAAYMLKRIGQLGLWQKWGFDSIVDYIAQAGIPVATQRLALLLSYVDDLAGIEESVPDKNVLRLELADLFGRQPQTMDVLDLLPRLERVEALFRACRAS